MGPQHKRVYARLRRAMRGDDRSRLQIAERYRTNSRIALSNPSSVSAYMRPPMSWRMMRIDWV